MPETRSLHRKLAQVMHEVGRIPKNGVAPQAMGGYRFVQVGDAADAIREALAAQLITMMPTNVQVVGQADRPTKAGGTMTTVDLVTTWTLTDAESGETIEIQSFGAGADGGDKYSGKASTSAMKYALLTGFLLSTGEDSELGNAEAGDAPSPVKPPDVETEELMAETPKRSGMVRLGGALGYKLEARQGPTGHVIGFRFETDKGEVPQVVVDGPAGEALFLATSQLPESMKDTSIRLKGRLYQVKRPGRKSYTRLHVTEWEWGEWKFPGPDAPALPEPPPDIALVGEQEAPTAPLFDDVA